MSVSDHTRKVLWALARNTCARCGLQLVREPEDAADRHAVVGEECHIVARSTRGPRGRQDPGVRDLDGVENLILLCASCHTIVDSQPAEYTVQALRALKQDHERRMAASTAPSTPPDFSDVRLEPPDKPTTFVPATSGDVLLSRLAHAQAFGYTMDGSLASETRELVGDLLQACQDWGDIYDEIGPKGHMDAAQNLQDLLDGLTQAGLRVLVGRRQRRMVFQGRAMPWTEAIVHISGLHPANDPVPA